MSFHPHEAKCWQSMLFDGKTGTQNWLQYAAQLQHFANGKVHGISKAVEILRECRKDLLISTYVDEIGWHSHIYELFRNNSNKFFCLK